jgi:hypothetical protein
MNQTPRMRRLVSLGAAVLFGAALWGCGLASGPHAGVKPLPDFAAKPAPRSVPAQAAAAAFFPDPSRMTANPAYPFARSWVDPSVDFTRFRTISIAPVSLAYLRPAPAGGAGDADASARKEAALQAAIRVPDAVEKAVARSGTLKVGHDTGAGTVVSSTAIVQLVPNLTAHDASQPGAQMLIGSMTSQTSKPVAVEPGEIAMETILRDGDSYKVIAMFADTQRAEVSPAAAAAPSKYGFVDRAIDDWARNLVRVISSTAGNGAAVASSPARGARN